ncbi:high mobility group box domain-containing protein [Xylariaceae sp. FL0804]|nr:high mobility group box domain-containing protein [Xylariaceae sp. FL0804]
MPAEAASNHDGDHVKKPSNSWILWRKAMLPTLRAELEEQRIVPTWTHLSKIASKQWKALPQNEKQKWEDKAAAVSAEHKAKNPGYVYKPKKTAVRAGKKPAARARAKLAAENDQRTKPGLRVEQRPLPQGTVDPALLSLQPVES